MKIKIPFMKEFKPCLLEEEKIMTARNKKYGEAGDRFSIFGAEFEIIFVAKVPLDFVAKKFYMHEGFMSPNGFIETWEKLHPGRGWEPERIVFLHIFRRID